jgi:hypothetical protein
MGITINGRILGRVVFMNWFDMEIVESAVNDSEVSKTEDECYDIAWFDDDGYIELRSLAVVVLCAAIGLNLREFEALVGFYAKAQGAAHDIMWKRFCEVDHEITSQDYRRQIRRMYHLLRPYVRDIFEEVKEHHERRHAAKQREEANAAQDRRQESREASSLRART